MVENCDVSEELLLAWRTLPLWSATKPQRPELPRDSGKAVSVYPKAGVLPSPTSSNMYPLFIPLVNALSMIRQALDLLVDSQLLP